MNDPYTAVGASPNEFSAEDVNQVKIVTSLIAQKVEEHKPLVAAAGQELAERLKIAGAIDAVISIVPSIGSLMGLMGAGGAVPGGLGVPGAFSSDDANLLGAFIFGKIKEKASQPSTTVPVEDPTPPTK